MYSVAPSWRPSARSRSSTSAGSWTRALRAPEGLHRRARTVRGQLQQLRRARQPLPPVAELPLQHLARAAARAARRRSRRTAPAAPAAATPARRGTPRRAPTSSRKSTPMLQPSETMWCMHSSSTCSSSPSRSSRARNSGPAARSKGRAGFLARAAASSPPPAPPRPARRGPRRGARSPRTARSPATGAPSTSRKTVRRASCRRTISPSARSSAAASSAPPSRSACGDVVEGAPRLEPVQEPEPLLREGERQRPRALRTGATGGSAGAPARRVSSTRAASSATVGPSNSARSGSSTPNSCRTRETTRVASSECPPSSKKSSVDAHPLQAQHLRPDPRHHLLRRRARRHVALRRSAAQLRRRQRPAVQLAVARQRQPVQRHERAPAPCTPAASRRRCSRSARPRPRPPTTYATRRFSPGASSRTTTAHSAHPGVRAAAPPRSRPARCGSRGS